MATDDETIKSVEALYNRWMEAWRTVSGAEMKALWDQKYPSLVYQAEENKTALLSWQEIEAYWDNTPSLIDAIPEVRDVRHNISLLGDYAVLYGVIFLRMRVKNAKLPFDDELRVSIVMRGGDDGLKFIHYHESRFTDLAYLF